MPAANLASVISPQVLEDVLLVMTFVGGGAMLADKVAAKIGLDRMSEQSLAFIALLGGFAGITLGGLFFNHKTSKPGFWFPVGVAWALWARSSPSTSSRGSSRSEQWRAWTTDSKSRRRTPSGGRYARAAGSTTVDGIR